MNHVYIQTIRRRHRADRNRWHLCAGIVCLAYLLATVSESNAQRPKSKVRATQSPRAVTAEQSAGVVAFVPEPLTSFASAAALAPATNRTVNVRLAWDASPDHGSVSNYIVHIGAASRTYTNTVNAGRALSVTISNLASRTRYYFAASAISSNGTRSDFSPEIFWPAPFTNYVGVGIKTNGRVILQLTYTNPPGDVVLFEPFIWVTNDAVSVLKLNTGGLIVGNTNAP